MSEDTISVTVFNSEGTGFGEIKIAEADMTIGKFVGKEVRQDASNYTVTVNGEMVAPQQKLHANDKIVIMPKKHGGARRTKA